MFPSAPSIETKLPVFHDTKAGVVLAERYQKAVVAFLRKYKNITIFEETSIVSIENGENKVKLIA
jgi:2-polyprenyl-6-methoxyphenol hydroxylase-like FAD-dependent oxidoreductase